MYMSRGTCCTQQVTRDGMVYVRPWTSRTRLAGLSKRWFVYGFPYNCVHEPRDLLNAASRVFRRLSPLNRIRHAPSESA